VELVDSGTVIARLTGARTAFVAFNTGPWTAMNDWAAAIPLQTEIALLLHGDGQLTPDYLTSDMSPKIGSIADLWRDWAKSPLFRTFVEVLGQVWQIAPTNLVQQANWVHTGQRIHGRFSRN
jgi:hypothetical protein